MRAHILNESGLILNTCMVSALDAGMVDADLYGGGPGDSIIGGVLVLAPTAPNGPTFAEQKAEYLDTVRDLREKILIRLNGYGAGLLLNEPPALADEKALCSTIINGLLDITTIPSVAAATDLATLTSTVKTEYARLVGMASVEMVKAFRKVDL